MNKIVIIALLMCANSTCPSYAQGFLDKIGKGLEKVNKELDRLGGKEGQNKSSKSSKVVRLAEVSNPEGGTLYSNVRVRSFNPNVTMGVESCIREDTKITITYSLTNSGSDLTILGLGVSKNVINPTEETLILDTNGNSYELRYYSLGSGSDAKPMMSVPTGVRLKGKLEIYNVPRNLRQLSIVNIAGFFNKAKAREADDLVYFSFAFRDVPIYTAQDLFERTKATPLLTVKEPFITNSPDNFGIESVEFTNNYTKVDFYYRNIKYNPVAYLTLDESADIHIAANGKTYALINYWGITPRQGDVSIKFNDIGRYSYIFEPVPADIAAFDIPYESMTGVVIKSDVNIPKTTGMFKSLDIKYDAFYKQPRMTAADRAKYKINNIKSVELPKQISNNQLAKGKPIYKCGKGSLETFLFIETDQVTSEYLVSYDKLGNVIDCIGIGNISAYGGDRGYADISGDTITVYSWYPAEGDEESGDTVTRYRVRPDFKFIKE